MVNSLYNPKWLEGEYHPKIEAYYFREWKNYNMEMHTHNQVEIMYVLKGNGSVITQDNTFVMHKSDFILIDANVPHRLFVDKDESCRILNVEFDFNEKRNSFPAFKEVVFDNEPLKYLISEKKPYWFLKDSEEIYQVFKSLVIELGENKSDSFMVQLLLAQILIKISILAKSFETSSNVAGSLYVRKAVSFIHQHYDQDIKIDDIAKAVNIHKGHLHRIFKQNIGVTPIEYLSELKLKKAKMLLSKTDIPIIEICSFVGISSRQYFTAMFKKHTGVSPAAYRKSHKSIVKQNI